jgi:glycerol-3-phosphate dehydrogenase
MIGQNQQLDADVIVIGSGIGGLVTATQLAVKGYMCWFWSDI